MPLTPNIQAGLSQGAVQNQTNQSGYPIITTPRGSNPDDIISRATGSQTVTSRSFPSDLPKYYFGILEHGWNGLFGTNTSARQTLNLEKSYRLQLPSTIEDKFDVNYNNNFSYLENAASVFSSLSGAGQGAISRTAGQLGGAASAASGLYLNTFKSVTLDSPSFKTFNLAWKFGPKNFQESQELQRIIFSLRRGMTPETRIGKALFVFPKIYALYFFPNVKYLYKFKPCVLSSLKVNYTGGNEFPTFYKSQGANTESPPEAITLETAWIELEYWRQQDYQVAEELPTNDPFSDWNFYTNTPATSASNANTNIDPNTNNAANGQF